MVEFVSNSGLKPETIVSRMSHQLDGKLTHNVDSIETISAGWWPKNTAGPGYKHKFLKGKPPRQWVDPSNPEVSETVAYVLDEQVKGLLNKGAISEVAKVTDHYISTYFAIPKSKRVLDKWRPILNLKNINKSVCHVKFRI